MAFLSPPAPYRSQIGDLTLRREAQAVYATQLAGILRRDAGHYHLSSVRCHVLSGLYSFMFWKISRVFGPKSFWYTIPS